MLATATKPSVVEEGHPGWMFKPEPLDWSQRRLGTVVPDIDLEHLTDAQFDRISNALLLHSVIVIKRQKLSVAKQVAFSKRFGPLERSLHTEYTDPEYRALLVISNVTKDGKLTGFTGAKWWHTDFSFVERTGFATILYGIEVPPVGADTMFADLYAAYDALPEDMKRRVDGKQVLHSYRLRYKDGGLDEEQWERCQDVIHPLVRTVPQTGRRALLLGCRKSAFVQGMSLEEGNAMINELIDFATQPQFVYSHKWEPGDVLIWDNRAVTHTATPFDGDRYRRILHRTSTKGERPFFA